MSLLRFWLSDTPLTTKLFIFSALLIIVPLLIVGLISYHQSSVELEEEARQYSWQVMEQIESHVEYYVRDLEIISLKILNHPDLAELVKAGPRVGPHYDAFRKQVEFMLKNAAYSGSEISNITVILDGAEIAASDGHIPEGAAINVTGERWYSAVPYNGGSLLFTRILQHDARNEPVMTLARRIYSPQTLEPVGILLVDVNYRRIKDIADKVSVTRKGYFYILDSEGHYVYHPDEKKLGKVLEKLDFSLFTQADEGTSLRVNKGEDFITFSHSANLGWRFVTSIPYAELSRPAGRIGETVLLTTLLTLAAAYILGVFFAASLIRPIRRMQHFMRQVEVGDFSSRVKVESGDELGQLSKGFNKMVEKLASLVEEVYFSKLRETEGALRSKDMELKVLQSQINPHFLYNSLETIRGMALEKEEEDIATMAAALGHLLRYNLRSKVPVVPLRDEIRVCQVYLQIQQFRFEGQFTYEFCIPDWAWDLSMIKFSLQPLIENCFTHGMGMASRPLSICITACQRDEQSFVIEVSDNGPGIEQDTLDRIRADLRQKDITQGGHSIGLVNVHRRISRIYEADYGLSVQSVPGQGTTVTLRLPLSVAIQKGDAG